VVQVELELLALEITNMKLVSGEGKAQVPGPEASILKVKGSEIQQTLTELAMIAMGPYALAYLVRALSGDRQDVKAPSSQYAPEDGPLTGHYFNVRKTTIYGGSTEVQKNIISQMILGL